MQISFTPSVLSGTLEIPPSKSMSHRALICAALSDGVSTIDNIIFSKDIDATINAMTAIGAKFIKDDKSRRVTVTGIDSVPKSAEIRCNESGSTLRFTIPIACALGINAEFHGKGKLPARPITPYVTEFKNHGVEFDYHSDMPFSVRGWLTPGKYYIDGNISSQFITGLMFALPLLSGDSEIHIRGELESKPYADMTAYILKKYGIDVAPECYGYKIRGNQKYRSADYTVEADFSQAAFFLVGSAAASNSIICRNLDLSSVQGDKQIIDILRSCGADISAAKDGGITVAADRLSPFEADAKNIPDLVPILCVLASICDGRSSICNIERLRIKESDRVESSVSLINSLGGRAFVQDEKIIIDGGARLRGGNVQSFNDHRIAMASAIASSVCDSPVTLSGAEAVDKSYPDFYLDFKKLGGKASVINLEQ